MVSRRVAWSPQNHGFSSERSTFAVHENTVRSIERAAQVDVRPPSVTKHSDGRHELLRCRNNRWWFASDSRGPYSMSFQTHSTIVVVCGHVILIHTYYSIFVFW